MADEPDPIIRAPYVPSKEKVKLRQSVYEDVETMMKVKDQTYRQFNDEFGDHTLMEYVDSSQKRLNGYTLPREEQGKEEWQK